MTMTDADLEMDRVDWLSTGTVGPPGQRTFFIQARQGHRQVTLQVEKAHVQALAERVAEILASMELASAPQSDMSLQEPLEPSFRVSDVGLGFHEERGLFVLVARELRTETEEAARVARLWITPQAIGEFAARAREVTSKGRPLCPHCGLPVDPAGHPCPAANGSKPIF